MANTIAQENAVIEKLSATQFTEIAKRAAIVKELGVLSFSQRVFDTLKATIDNCWGDSYIPGQNDPMLAAFDVLAGKLHLIAVREFVEQHATSKMESFAVVNDKARSIIRQRDYAAMIAACDC